MGARVTKHNFLQRRARLLNQVRDATTSYLWFCNQTHPQAKRATTLAARRMMEATRDLWRLGAMPK